MPLLTSDRRFFGMDVSSLWAEVATPWMNMHKWPVFRWLTPSIPIVLLRADGTDSIWVDGVQQAHKAPRMLASSKTFFAVEVPEDEVLLRTLLLHQVAETQVHGAIELEALAASPFVAEDLVWGYRVESTVDGPVAAIAITARKHVDAVLGRWADRLESTPAPEVWVFASDGKPIVMQGTGGGLREAKATMARRLAYGLIVLAMVIATACALSPVAQLWLRSVDAAKALGEQSKKTRAVMPVREQLLATLEKLNALHELTAERMDLLSLLEKLTETLPDDTFIQTLKFDSGKVSIVGITSNSAALMQLLGNQPGIKEVRSSSPSTRLGNTGKEAFAAEFSMDAQVFGLPQTPKAVLQGAPAISNASSPTPATPAIEGSPGNPSVPSQVKPSAATPPVTSPTPKVERGAPEQPAAKLPPAPKGAPAPGPSFGP